MFSSAGGFAYAQLLPPAVERDGQIAEQGSNLVTLSSPLLSPPPLLTLPMSPRLSLQSGAGGCRLPVGRSGESAYTKRSWRFFPEGFLAKKPPTTQNHNLPTLPLGLGGGGGGVMAAVPLPREWAWQAVLVMTGLATLIPVGHGE